MKRMIIGICIMTCMLLSNSLSAQELSQEKQQLQQAINDYTFARFDEAILKFTSLIYSSNLTQQDRKQIYLYLGRSYLAKDLLEEAMKAVTRFLMEFGTEVDISGIEPPNLRELFRVAKKKLLPSAPTDAALTKLDKSSVSLKWKDTAENEKGFIIMRKQGTSAWDTVATVTANQTNYQDAKLMAKETYLYRVYAYNQNGPSEPSNEVSITISTGKSKMPYYIGGGIVVGGIIIYILTRNHEEDLPEPPQFPIELSF